MSKLDDILPPNNNWVKLTDKGYIELKTQLKDLMLELVGDDIDLIPLKALPSLAMRASGQNQEKWSLREKIEAL